MTHTQANRRRANRQVLGERSEHRTLPITQASAGEQKPSELDRGKRESKPYTSDDITMVMGVRCHQHNPWVLERLALFASHYQPRCQITIVDFGSQEPYRAQLAKICLEGSMTCLHIEDDGVYSAACARNHGAATVTTDLVVFTDVDFFGESDLIAQLARFANAIDIALVPEQIINLPIYHLNAEATAAIVSADTPMARSERIARSLAHASYSAHDDGIDFVAPYSNFFLCTRDFFQTTGGFNEFFRGHGSEDFEYLLRFALVSGRFPIPDNAIADRYAPKSGRFYDGNKSYTGFRRLFELMAFQAECAGLRIVHLDHSKPEGDSWIRKNDWKRTEFQRQVAPIIESPRSLISYDWLPREKNALVVVQNDSDVPLLLALRNEGYHLQMVSLPAGVERAIETHVEAQRVDVLVCVGPFPKEAHLLHAAARTMGVEIRTLEPATTTGHEATDAIASSYAAARLGLGRPAFIAETVETGRGRANLQARLRKFARDPKRFLEESRFSSLRTIGKRLR